MTKFSEENGLDTDGMRRCRQCFYLLKGLDRNRCPECGRPFDPADPQTFTTFTQKQRRRQRVERAVGTCVLLVVLAPIALKSWNAYLEHRYVGVLHAASSGDWASVQRRILAGYDVNSTGGPCGSTRPIHIAAEAGKGKIVGMLLKAGARADAYDGDRQYPLHKAAASGSVEAVNALLAAGSQVDPLDLYMRRPMEYAAQGGHFKVVKVLVAAGSSPDHPDEHDYGFRSALHLAAQEGHVDVVEFLLAQGADGDAVGDYWGPRREHWAASAGRKILGSNYLDRCSTTPLELAAAEGHVDVMKLLLAAGASITGSSESGGSPLHWAAGGGHVEAVDLLLAEGAWIDARPDDQWYDATLIHCAAYFGQVDTVRQLLELGAEIYSQAHVSLVTKHNGPDWYSIQGTPLHAASYMGHPAVVKLLIEAGARISSRNLDGLTALDVARQERRTRVVEVLQAAEKRE